MALTTTALLPDLLQPLGVLRLYGTEDPVSNRVVPLPDAGAAAIAALTDGKLTGSIGACCTPAGDSALPLIHSLFEARRQRVPMLALTHQQNGQRQRNSSPKTDEEWTSSTARLLHGVTGFSRQPSAEDLPDTIAEAIRYARQRQTVTHLHLVLDRPWRPSSPRAQDPNPPADPPPAALLEQAIDRLQSTQKIVVVAGAGSFQARGEILTMADRLGAPVVETTASAGMLQGGHPQFAGTLGLRCDGAARMALRECEAILLVGGLPGKTELLTTRRLRATPILQIDPEAQSSLTSGPLFLHGPLASTLQALQARLKAVSRRDFLQQMLQQRPPMETVQAEIRSLPASPRALMSRLRRAAPETTLFTCDPGLLTRWALLYLPAAEDSQEPHLALPTGGVRLPFALPAAMGARQARPERPVVALAGEDSHPTLLAHFRTAVRHSIPLTVIAPRFHLPPDDPTLPELVRLCGGAGILVTEADRLEEALHIACRSPQPWLVEVPILHGSADEDRLDAARG